VTRSTGSLSTIWSPYTRATIAVPEKLRTPEHRVLVGMPVPLLFRGRDIRNPLTKKR
jgi:hypothetical protein